MEFYNCERIINKLEKEMSFHQIFWDVDGNSSSKRVKNLKKIAVLADHFGIKEFINAFVTYIEICKNECFHNLFEAMIFETVFEKYIKMFSEILDFTEKLEIEGIEEFPISANYDIESWATKWDITDEYLAVLEKWFYIDYKKIK